MFDLNKLPLLQTVGNEDTNLRPVQCLQLRELTVIIITTLLQVTRGTRDPNLQVIIMHALHVCSQYSFGLPQFDHAHFNLLPLVL